VTPEAERLVPIRWTEDGEGLIILDQTELPANEVYGELRTLDAVREAIRSLRVRGAPLIGITAAMGVAALARAGANAARSRKEGSGDAVTELSVEDVSRWCEYLAEARPTAVNLRWALERVRRAATLLGENTPPQLASPLELADALVREASAILNEDREMCESIGRHALPLVVDGTTVLTHCNAGALATGGIGTALAPLYLAHSAGRRIEVFSDETRPLLQGSRLTAWELGRAGIDVKVITDSSAGALFGERPPDVVLVGADRIAANGDVVNKVGTYTLAVLARHHGVPFYVLAPTSTIDLACPLGSDVPIEFRDAREITEGFGPRTAPLDAEVWSPAFDVTPSALITGIVTERGIHVHPLGEALAGAVQEAERERNTNPA
jgi:methylthioribose-1-phosphate isomerase